MSTYFFETITDAQASTFNAATDTLVFGQTGERANITTVRYNPATATSAATITLISVALGPGCQTRCFNKFDCGDGSYCSPLGRCETECFTDLDCRQPPECAGTPTSCPPPRGFRCDPNGRCIGSYEPPRTGTMRMPTGDGPFTGPIDG